METWGTLCSLSRRRLIREFLGHDGAAHGGKDRLDLEDLVGVLCDPEGLFIRSAIGSVSGKQ